VTLHLTDADVAELLSPEVAIEAVEACLLRMATGAVTTSPRDRLQLEEGSLSFAAAADVQLGYAGLEAQARSRGEGGLAVLLFRSTAPELVAVLESETLGRLGAGAATGVAVRHLARPGAASLGLIGCGRLAEAQLACIRAALPSLERTVAYCRTRERLHAFCARTGAEPAESHRDPADCDIVVTVTTSPDPVLRGEWLRAGALVCAVGANDGRKRELDNVVVERATFVCCDSLEEAQAGSADLIEPVDGGVLDWLEVHELHEVVSGAVAGRQSESDIVLFKSNGLSAWDIAGAATVVERALARGRG